MEMSVGGCPENLEDAIMFLYGIYPYITTESIAHLLDLAEFLVIPNLKAVLVEWLQHETVTQDNFIQFLHLASLYEFDLPNCEVYVRANLNTCFENRDFVLLAKESVITLLSDSTLNYVGSNSKLKFILDWLRYRGPAWSDVVREFIQLIDMEELSPHLMAEAQNDPVFQRCNIPISCSRGNSTDRTVLLMKFNGMKNAFLVYDLERNLWFRLHSAHAEQVKTLNKDRSNSSPRSVIYSVRNGISILDIEKDTTSFTTFVTDENDLTYSAHCYSNGVVWVLFHRSELLIRGSDSSNKRMKSDRLYKLYHESKKVGIIYNGILNTEGGVTEMTPVLSFPFEMRPKIYINESNNIVCCRQHDGVLHIFDTNLYTLDIVPINETYYWSRLCPTRSGFVLYSDTEVLDIARQAGPQVGSRYTISEIDLSKTKQYRYLYVENMFIRWNWLYYGRSPEWVSYDDLKQCTSLHELHWQAMTPLSTSYAFMADAVKVVLPQSELNCHADCPHCYQQLYEERKQNMNRPIPRIDEFDIYDDSGNYKCKYDKYRGYFYGPQDTYDY